MGEGWGRDGAGMGQGWGRDGGGIRMENIGQRRKEIGGGL